MLYRATFCWIYKKWLFNWDYWPSYMDQGCTGSLSLHCQEREVFVALWSQPHALPSSLGTTWPMPTHKSLGPTLNLEWASQQLQPNGPAGSSWITVQPLQSPHLSHKLALPSPANILSPTESLKDQKLLLIGQCGSKFICRRAIHSLYVKRGDF